MMHAWRLLPLETNNAAMNMAIDEAILTARINGQVPNTLRFYRWQPSAVSIGKNQNPEAEVYIDACKRLGVDVVRRISGGGAVYHDYQGEVTYSVIAKTADLGSVDITSVYAKIYEAIQVALGLLGITADFSSGDTRNCPNMTVKGKKISGSSQAISRGVVLQHGTVLRTVDLIRMFTLLKLKNASCSQAVDIAKRKITSVENELGRVVAPETVADALAIGFASVLNLHFEIGRLTAYEDEIANKLFNEKYTTNEWIFERKNA
jgi:lipoate-protein ligase A